MKTAGLQPSAQPVLNILSTSRISSSFTIQTSSSNTRLEKLLSERPEKMLSRFTNQSPRQRKTLRISIYRPSFRRTLSRPYQTLITGLQNLTSSGKLQIQFKLDALCECYVRVNTCVTEQRDMNNVPTTMFTPNKTDYIQEMKVQKGLGQTMPFEKIQFNIDALRSYELFSVYHTYFPLVISVNY